jgi:hypothetical protein
MTTTYWRLKNAGRQEAKHIHLKQIAYMTREVNDSSTSKQSILKPYGIWKIACIASAYTKYLFL